MAKNHCRICCKEGGDVQISVDNQKRMLVKMEDNAVEENYKIEIDFNSFMKVLSDNPTNKMCGVATR